MMLKYVETVWPKGLWQDSGERGDTPKPEREENDVAARDGRRDRVPI